MDNANKKPTETVDIKDDEIVMADGDFFEDMQTREKKWLADLGVNPDEIEK